MFYFVFSSNVSTRIPTLEYLTQPHWSNAICQVISLQARALIDDYSRQVLVYPILSLPSAQIVSFLFVSNWKCRIMLYVNCRFSLESVLISSLARLRQALAASAIPAVVYAIAQATAGSGEESETKF